MGKKIKATYIQEITVIDPDTKQNVEVSIYKLATGGMVGIDSSFLGNTDLPVYSPFDKNMEIDVE